MLAEGRVSNDDDGGGVVVVVPLSWASLTSGDFQGCL